VTTTVMVAFSRPIARNEAESIRHDMASSLSVNFKRAALTDTLCGGRSPATVGCWTRTVGRGRWARAVCVAVLSGVDGAALTLRATVAGAAVVGCSVLESGRVWSTGW
jgi:hypothetical protein